MASLESAVGVMNGLTNESEKSRPITTMFMLMSVDGKISTGSSDLRDFDTDLLMFNETKAGLHQYYELEKNTDEWCLCTGKTKAKIGINDKYRLIHHIDANIALIDSKHLTLVGVKNLIKQYNKVVLFTSNPKHPAMSIEDDKLRIHHLDQLLTEDILSILKKVHKCNYLTVQTGSTTNGDWIESHLIDFVDFVIAPIIVGGNSVPSVVGTSVYGRTDDLKAIALMQLDKCEVLKDNYVRLRYRVLNSK